jgi:hypothetical protein
VLFTKHLPSGDILRQLNPFHTYTPRFPKTQIYIIKFIATYSALPGHCSGCSLQDFFPNILFEFLSHPLHAARQAHHIILDLGNSKF